MRRWRALRSNTLVMKIAVSPRRPGTVRSVQDPRTHEYRPEQYCGEHYPVNHRQTIPLSGSAADVLLDCHGLRARDGQ
jgi:hypothetical protein